MLETNDNYILTYDRGAYDLAFHSTLAELFTLKLSAPIRNASIGSGDSFVVITDETGYKSTVTVYGASSVRKTTTCGAGVPRTITFRMPCSRRPAPICAQ